MKLNFLFNNSYISRFNYDSRLEREDYVNKLINYYYRNLRYGENFLIANHDKEYINEPLYDSFNNKGGSLFMSSTKECRTLSFYNITIPENVDNFIFRFSPMFLFSKLSDLTKRYNEKTEKFEDRNYMLLSVSIYVNNMLFIELGFNSNGYLYINNDQTLKLSEGDILNKYNSDKFSLIKPKELYENFYIIIIKSRAYIYLNQIYQPPFEDNENKNKIFDRYMYQKDKQTETNSNILYNLLKQNEKDEKGNTVINEKVYTCKYRNGLLKKFNQFVNVNIKSEYLTNDEINHYYYLHLQEKKEHTEQDYINAYVEKIFEERWKFIESSRTEISYKILDNISAKLTEWINYANTSDSSTNFKNGLKTCRNQLVNLLFNEKLPSMYFEDNTVDNFTCIKSREKKLQLYIINNSTLSNKKTLINKNTINSKTNDSTLSLTDKLDQYFKYGKNDFGLNIEKNPGKVINSIIVQKTSLDDFFDNRSITSSDNTVSTMENTDEYKDLLLNNLIGEKDIVIKFLKQLLSNNNDPTSEINANKIIQYILENDENITRYILLQIDGLTPANNANILNNPLSISKLILNGEINYINKNDYIDFAKQVILNNNKLNNSSIKYMLDNDSFICQYVLRKIISEIVPIDCVLLGDYYLSIPNSSITTNNNGNITFKLLKTSDGNDWRSETDSILITILLNNKNISKDVLLYLKNEVEFESYEIGFKKFSEYTSTNYIKEDPIKITRQIINDKNEYIDSESYLEKVKLFIIEKSGMKTDPIVIGKINSSDDPCGYILKQSLLKRSKNFYLLDRHYLTLSKQLLNNQGILNSVIIEGILKTNINITQDLLISLRDSGVLASWTISLSRIKKNPIQVSKEILDNNRYMDKGQYIYLAKQLFNNKTFFKLSQEYIKKAKEILSNANCLEFGNCYNILHKIFTTAMLDSSPNQFKNNNNDTNTLLTLWQKMFIENIENKNLGYINNTLKTNVYNSYVSNVTDKKILSICQIQILDKIYEIINSEFNNIFEKVILNLSEGARETLYKIQKNTNDKNFTFDYSLYSYITYLDGFELLYLKPNLSLDDIANAGIPIINNDTSGDISNNLVNQTINNSTNNSDESSITTSLNKIDSKSYSKPIIKNSINNDGIEVHYVFIDEPNKVIARPIYKADTIEENPYISTPVSALTNADLEEIKNNLNIIFDKNISERLKFNDIINNYVFNRENILVSNESHRTSNTFA